MMPRFVTLPLALDRWRPKKQADTSIFSVELQKYYDNFKKRTNDAPIRNIAISSGPMTAGKNS